MKNALAVILCGIMLLCLAACEENFNSNMQLTESTNQNETNSNVNTNNNTQSNESTEKNDTNIQATAIFKTENIKRITFYAYYGGGKGCDVPAEHLDEIITWLDSFELDKEVPELLPPGTNTINIEIEYFDGTVLKKGLDTATVDGITYYIKCDIAPECYGEILSKTSIN